MQRVLQFIIERRRSVAILVTVFFSISLMLMGQSSKTRLARAVTTTIFNTGHFTFSWCIYILDLWHENKRLRIQNLNLSEKISTYDIVIRENERLRSLLSLRERLVLSDSVIAATVIGRDFDRIVNTLILDAGSLDGVKKNMAVVTAEGLVGRVFEVYRSSASVQVLMDINSKVSSVTEGLYGIVRWEGGPYLRMYGLPLGTIPSKEGQKIYTSGQGGVFPQGILIGTVASTKIEDVEQYSSINVKPAVDFSSIQELFILKGSESSDIWDDGDGTGYFRRPDIQ